jgi:beta-lactamase regulating signal transducer with metallopeptidase domain
VSIVCFVVVLFLIYRASRRKAAVGRVEFLFFLVVSIGISPSLIPSTFTYRSSGVSQFYSLTLPLRILTTANVLKQGSSGLAVLSAVHVGLIVGIMWILLGNAVVATQAVA